MTQDELFMNEAIKEAEIAAHEGNWAIGSVIVVDGKIVARAHNTGYTDRNRLAHAEFKAILEAKDILEANRGKGVLYTTHDPCPMCLGAVILYKVARVVTGVNLDDSGALEMQAHLPRFFQQEKFRFSITRGILADQCKKVYMQGKPVEKHKLSGFLKI